MQLNAKSVIVFSNFGCLIKLICNFLIAHVYFFALTDCLPLGVEYNVLANEKMYEHQPLLNIKNNNKYIRSL